MTKLTDEDRAEIARLLAVAEGTAPREFYDDRDEEPPLNVYKETMSAEERAYLERVVEREKKEQKL